MHTPDDFPQREMDVGMLGIPGQVFRFGLMYLFAPLDEGLCLLRRLKGFCVMSLGPPLALLGILLVMPLYAALFYASAVWMTYSGQSAKFSDEEVIVHSRRRCVARLKWADIACLRKSFEPPFGLWEIVLNAGKPLSLPMVKEEELLAACNANGIPVFRELRAAGVFEEVPAKRQP